jgi:hypothetical protein
LLHVSGDARATSSVRHGLYFSQAALSMRDR